MKQPIYMIVGVPGSGKTWITNQIADKFEFCHHDGYIGHIRQPEAYVDGILEKAENARKPILVEAPFSISQIKEPLEQNGYKVTPVYIIEKPEVIAMRYWKREGKVIPKGHLTRLNTYAQRAAASRGFTGTANEVLEYLKSKVS
jgi:2-phosphoglycerate kinase